jgi:signal transduction histidine kinase
MQERVNLVGGSLKIWSDAHGGTEVFAYLPLDKRRSVASLAGHDAP